MYLEDLPTELHQLILSYLDASPPSIAKLYEEPMTAPADSARQPLKSFSQTSHRYRSLTSPYLFKFSAIPFQESALRESDADGPHGIGLLHSEVKSFLRFVVKEDMSRCISSLYISATHNVEAGIFVSSAARPAREVGDLWTSIFSVIRPYTITISAPPSTLAFMTSCGIHCMDEWAFKMYRHTLQLRISSDISRRDYPRPRRTNKLFDIVPWTHCILNEGSSIQVYNTYQYDAMIQPSVLHEYLLKDSSLRLLTSLRSFDYVAIFPLIGQVVRLLHILCILPNLKRVTVQLAPQKQNKVLEDASRVQRSLYSDLWMELETVFFLIAADVVYQSDCSINELICFDYQQESLWETLGRGGSTLSKHWRTIKDGHWKRSDDS
ncbi:hypothetical protein MMC11_004776 [Xylographa trunciseda]|nr:hypothetical protein [Xylographa trunciseda]